MGAEVLTSTVRAQELIRQGIRPITIFRMMNAEGVPITQNAIYQIKQRMPDVNPVNVDASALLPWPLRHCHRSLTDAYRLRDFARHLAKMPLPDRRKRLLMNWVADLRELDEVVDYEPVSGFSHVPRRYALNDFGFTVPVDTGLIKEPLLNDDGTRIEWTGLENQG